MNRKPVVSFVASIASVWLISTMAIHFCVLARLRPSRRVMRSPSNSPIFCRLRKGTVVKRPRPSMGLRLTTIGTGHFTLALVEWWPLGMLGNQQYCGGYHLSALGGMYKIACG